MTDNLSVKINDVAYSKDNISRKYIQSTNDNYRIETLWVDYKNKYIIVFQHKLVAI